MDTTNFIKLTKLIKEKGLDYLCCDVKSSGLYYMQVRPTGVPEITVKCGPMTRGGSLGYLEVFCNGRMVAPIGYMDADEAFELIEEIISGRGLVADE